MLAMDYFTIKAHIYNRIYAPMTEATSCTSPP